MQLKNKNILFISPQGWGDSHVSKHHYARELARRGNSVFFLNPPGDRFSTHQEEPLLQVVNYASRFRGLSKLPTFISSWLTRKEVESLEQKLSVSFDLIWNFDSSRFFSLNGLKRLLRICHMVDLNENIQRKKLAKSSDFCFCTTDFIKNELLKHNPKTFKIHHGYQGRRFATSPFDLNEIENNQKIKTGYIGNLNIKYLNWPLIFAIVDTHSEIDFYFVGSIATSNLGKAANEVNPYLEKTTQRPNAFFLGPKPANQIPSFLESMDVLLLAYQTESDLEQLASPHKMMEYLGSGKVIVSSYTDEYKDKMELIEMELTNGASLAEKFDQVVNNIDQYNSNEKKALRIEFAESHTYDKQCEKIEQIIFEHSK